MKLDRAQSAKVALPESGLRRLFTFALSKADLKVCSCWSVQAKSVGKPVEYLLNFWVLSSFLAATNFFPLFCCCSCDCFVGLGYSSGNKVFPLFPSVFTMISTRFLLLATVCFLTLAPKLDPGGALLSSSSSELARSE